MWRTGLALRSMQKGILRFVGLDGKLVFGVWCLVFGVGGCLSGLVGGRWSKNDRNQDESS